MSTAGEKFENQPRAFDKFCYPPFQNHPPLLAIPLSIFFSHSPLLGVFENLYPLYILDSIQKGERVALCPLFRGFMDYDSGEAYGLRLNRGWVMMHYDSGRGRLFWGDFMVYDSRVFDGGSWITTQRGTDTMRGPYGLRLERGYLNNYDSGAHFVDYDLCVFVCVWEREDSKGDFMDYKSGQTS